jgi:hypothetical protein
MKQFLYLPQDRVGGKQDESKNWRESHEEKRNQESTEEKGSKKEEEISFFSEEILT